MSENFTIDAIIESIRNLELPDILKDFFGKIAAGTKGLGRVTTGQFFACTMY